MCSDWDRDVLVSAGVSHTRVTSAGTSHEVPERVVCSSSQGGCSAEWRLRASCSASPSQPGFGRRDRTRTDEGTSHEGPRNGK